MSGGILAAATDVHTCWTFYGSSGIVARANFAVRPNSEESAMISDLNTAQEWRMTVIEQLRDVVQNSYGCAAFHWRTARVCEVFGEQIVWNRQVEVFKLRDHPKAEFCYAWAFENDDGKTQYIAVLELPPVTSPEKAVLHVIARQELTTPR
jgi:hypothetical protein